MKNIKSLLVLFIASLAISCSTDDVQDRPVIEPSESPMIIAPDEGNIYNLSFEQNSNLADRFVWSEADYGGDVEITYNVQIDNAGNEFANAESLGSIIGATQLGVTVETLNNTVLALGATPFEAAAYEVRVQSLVGGMEMNSDTKTITVSPYTTEAPKLYIVGSFLSAGGYGDDWTPGSAVPIAASGFGETSFEGFVNFAQENAQYKILPTNSSFDGDYGDAGDSDGAYTGVIEQDGEVNAGLPDGTAGYYQVKVDTEALTYSVTKTDWGIIGSATPNGWDADTDMTYDADAKVWTIDLDLTGGQFIKFRANDAWDINLGLDNDDDGYMNFGGPDIPVDADGNYTITLDLSNPRMYTYSLTMN
ncbi:MAG TPA: SusE domain-containing protein [Christiangramia sp.]|nr:SusE domain-containing protein [Christiangramia sp.]